ncbi:MAG: peptidase U32 family protein, partial [Candidatus Helarchaeota archaeon]
MKVKGFFSPSIHYTSRMVELLIPAQNKKSVQAAIGKADAIYFGVETFNMRMHARNVKQADMKKIINFCHEHGLKAYLTTNIIIYEGELGLLRSLIEDASAAEVDAFIVHDMATIQMVKEHEMPFHVSTQVSISNSLAARFYESLGATRINLARELTLSQISEIIQKLKKTKVETFIHGAMCTSISGRCYFSQALNEDAFFSANRGKCLQPCRDQWRVVHQDGHELDYDGYYFINAKDLCMIEYIPELMNAGIHAFKIEGRMRPPRYVEIVARVYREAIDAHLGGTFTKERALEWKKELEKAYNRSFSTGFYFGRPTADDVNRQTTGNLATTRKTEIGRVITYYKDKQIAKIRLFRGQIKSGTELYFEGSDMGTYFKLEVAGFYHKNRLYQESPETS